MKRASWLMVGAIGTEVLGLVCWSWSWGASFGPDRWLPETYDLLAPTILLLGTGGFGLGLSLWGLHEVLARGTRLQMLLGAPLMALLASVGATLLYGLLIVWSVV